MKYGIIPSFMAKPHSNLPGCSGHVHISLWSADKKDNLFAGQQADPSWPEHTAKISVQAEEFIAGLMTCLADIVPCLIPTVNGYKRLVEGFWAATQVSWGLDSRLASVRIIAPPNCDPKATRLEVRVPGADMNPHVRKPSLLAYICKPFSFAPILIDSVWVVSSTL
jgi:glutamine synthetase